MRFVCRFVSTCSDQRIEPIERKLFECINFNADEHRPQRADRVEWKLFKLNKFRLLMNGTSTAGLSALQLAAGMLKLAGTSNAVTAQEATELLPIWQSLQQMESAMPQRRMQQGGFQGTPNAPQPNPTMMAMRQQVATQITAIENAMPPAQIQAITAMNLSGQDIFTAFQQAGITMGGPGQGGGFRSSNGGTFTPPQGGTPPVAGTPGAFRGGGFGQGGQGGGRMGMGSFIPSSVVTGIIQFLQKTAGS